MLATDASSYAEQTLSIRPDFMLDKGSYMSGLWLGQQRLTELQCVIKQPVQNLSLGTDLFLKHIILSNY